MYTALECEMCRICMRTVSKNMLIGLFEYIIQAQSLAKVVSLVGAVEVQQNDELPKLCCTECLREVEAAFKLRTLCRESDVKLRSNLPNKVAVEKHEPFIDNASTSLDREGLVSNDEVLARKEADEVHPWSHIIPNKAVTVKKELCSDDEMNLLLLEDHNRGNEDLAKMEMEDLNSFTLDTVKHENEEITLEEIRIIDVSVSENIDDNSSNNQELTTNVSEKKRRYYRNMLRTFYEVPAVKFNCCVCASIFDTIEELSDHGREKHCDADVEEFTLMERQCDICFKVLCNRKTYDFHRRMVMSNFRCKVCDEIVITLKQTIAHKALKHKRRIPTADEALICCGCKMRFHSAKELRIHSKMIHLPKKPPSDEMKPVTCNICYRNYTCEAALRRHKFGFLKKCRKKLVCKECGITFGERYDLARHEKRAHAKSHIAPVIFDHATKSTLDVVKHENEEITVEETSIMDASCSESDQCSESKVSISENVNENSCNNQELKTNVSKRKRRYINYRRVLKTFDEILAVKFRCCGCASIFDTIEGLRAHSREKHYYGDSEEFTLKDRQCDICFQVLCNRRTYDLHRKMVMYNFRCKICDEIVFTLKQTSAHKALKHRRRKPTADEALICCGCKMRFHSAEELKIHSKMIHLPRKPPSDKMKPVSCNICYRNFTCIASVRSHKFGFLKKSRKKIVCKECGTTFGEPYDLARHEKRAHAKSHTAAPVTLDHATKR